MMNLQHSGCYSLFWLERKLVLMFQCESSAIFFGKSHPEQWGEEKKRERHCHVDKRINIEPLNASEIILLIRSWFSLIHRKTLGYAYSDRIFQPSAVCGLCESHVFIIAMKEQKKRNENFEYGIWMLWASLSTSSRADQHRCQKFNSNDSQTNGTKTHKSEAFFFVGHNLCNCVYVAESQIWETVVYHPSLCIPPNRDNIQNAHPDTFSKRPTRVRQKKRAFYWVSILMCLLLPLISGCMCVW